jgi:hypothetical protein
VTDSVCSSLALIVDHDLGFVMWLGEVFLELGCQAVPALHCRQALVLAKRMTLPITTLVMNPELPGATRTVKALVAANPAMRVVLIRNSAAYPGTNGGNGDTPNPGLANPKAIPARSILEKPAPWETISRTEWVAKVRTLLANGSVRKNH